jgi:hypothetical protein
MLAASASPIAVERIAALFAQAEAEDLRWLAERVAAEERQQTEHLLINVANRVRQHRRLSRARRADRQALCAVTGDNLVWACGMLLPCWKPNDPFRHELAQALASEAAQATQLVERIIAGGWFDQANEQALRARDARQETWTSWQTGDPGWQALKGIERLAAINARAATLRPSSEQVWLSNWCQSKIATWAEAFTDWLQDLELNDAAERELFLIEQTLAVATAALCSLANPAQTRLAQLTQVHQRVIGDQCLATIPAFAVPDLDLLAAISISAWFEPLHSERTRALAYDHQCILIGPDETATCLAAADRGQLTPVLFHELLHCLPATSADNDRSAAVASCDHAFQEGGLQAWAEAICATGVNDHSELRGGRERTVAYIGWKWTVRAVAVWLKRPVIEVSSALAQAGHGQACALIAGWLFDDDQQIEQVAELFGPLLSEVHHRRWQAGTGQYAYQQTLAMLATLA